VADAAASSVTAPRVVLAGIGTGYIADALRARGIVVAAAVERASVIAGALQARDLSEMLEGVRVIALEDLATPGVLARLRAAAPAIVVHAPSAAVTPALQSLAERWDSLRPARSPRVLVAGPIAGGSLGVADAVERAACRLGCEVRRFDGRPFAGAHDAFRTLPVNADGYTALLGQFTLLLGEAIARIAAEWRADLVLALAQAPLAGPSLDQLRASGIPSAFWFVENVRVLPYWREVARFYDHVFAIQQGDALEQIAAAGAPHVDYLPLACDAALHAPLDLDDEDRRRFGAPVSFAGAPYLNRRHVLEAVRDLGLRVWGEGWEHTPLAPCLGMRGRFGPEAMRKIFAATRVNLNVHSAGHVTGLDPEPDYVNPRTFELAACGAFQLVDRRNPLPALFDDGEIATFASVSEMRAAVVHHLAHPDEAAAVASRAQARVLRDHTYDRRVAALLARVLPAHLQPGAEADTGQTLDDALAQAGETPALEDDEIELRILADLRAAAAR
jgi:spore maturation protein CgeB